MRKLMEIANATEAVHDGRIYIERINEQFLKADGSPAEYVAGHRGAIHPGGRGPIHLMTGVRRVGRDLQIIPRRQLKFDPTALTCGCTSQNVFCNLRSIEGGPHGRRQ